MLNQTTVMIDFETSGMSPDQGGRVTEVAALRIVGDQVVDRFVSLINCNVWIPPFITSLTGITQAMVDGAQPASEVIPELINFIGTDTLAAHNASFDEKFLIAEAQRLDLQPEHQGMLCTVKLSRRILPGLSTYSLGPLASHLGIRFKGNAHRAEADAEVASALLVYLSDHLRQQHQFEWIDSELLQKLSGLPATKVPKFLKECRLEKI